MASPEADFNFSLKPFAESVLFYFQIVSCLQVEPEALGRSKIPSQPQRGVSADCPRPMNNFVDAPRWYAGLLGQAVLADTKGTQEFLIENFSRMDGSKLSASHGNS